VDGQSAVDLCAARFRGRGQVRLGRYDLGLPFAAFSFRHGVAPVGRGGSYRSLLHSIVLRLRVWPWLPISRQLGHARRGNGGARLGYLRPCAAAVRVVTAVQHGLLWPPRCGRLAAVARTRRFHGGPARSVVEPGLVGDCGFRAPARQSGQVLIPQRCHARVQPGGVPDELVCPRLIALSSGGRCLVEDALGVDLGAVPLPQLSAGRVECGGPVGEPAGALEIPCTAGSVRGGGRPVSQGPVIRVGAALIRPILA